jgi:hypothetical protein
MAAQRKGRDPEIRNGDAAPLSWHLPRAPLLADSLGGRVAPAKSPEIGVLPLSKTAMGESDQAMSNVPDPPTFFEWHGAEVVEQYRDHYRECGRRSIGHRPFEDRPGFSSVPPRHFRFVWSSRHLGHRLPRSPTERNFRRVCGTICVERLASYGTPEIDPFCSRRAAPCPFRKSYPDVLVVQSNQDRNGDNGARSLDCSMQGRIFL